MLDTVVPDEVKTEVIRRYVNDKQTWERAHEALMKVKPRTSGTSSKSVQFIENWIRRHHGELPIARTIHPGEKHCGALALTKSADEDGLLNLTIVDDSSARVALNHFFCRHVVGVAVSTPDLILLLRNRIGRVTKEQAVGAINDFYSGYMDSLRSPLKPGYLADVTACWREARAENL
jgi:hypothetical protein